MMDEVIPHERASRDFRVKFPDDVMQENLAGQLWFGAEVGCLWIMSLEVYIYLKKKTGDIYVTLCLFM